MGLTIHYTLQSKGNPEEIHNLVQKMYQLALDLPFEKVSNIVDLQGRQECNFELRRQELQNGNEENGNLFWLLIQSTKYVNAPWDSHLSRQVTPERIIAFTVDPGEGSESANIGMCLYPKTIQWNWKNVPTRLPGWRWASFCKTQYASNPDCGGIPNFLKCHISLITLLDRIKKLPNIKVTIDDEGKYGPSTYSDDWEEAYAAGRKPTYKKHKGKYNPKLLAEEVGDWNQMIASFAGTLSDIWGSDKLAAPIKEFPNFEHLEFKGNKSQYLKPFLETMQAAAKVVQQEKEEHV